MHFFFTALNMNLFFQIIEILLINLNKILFFPSAVGQLDYSIKKNYFFIIFYKILYAFLYQILLNEIKRLFADQSKEN